LKTVNVLASNKKITVFDKQNKKLWEGALTYNVEGGAMDPEAMESGVGQGPCVERNKTLYVFDEGVLTAFDLATGNAQWRVPSVGITGLFFDDKDMLLVNTTDASPESIKYSRQIDISKMPSGQLLKIDPKDGKILWKATPPGPVTYVSGKFIYCVQSYTPIGDDDRDSIMGMAGMPGTRPFLRIKRLKPSNGKEMWEHYENRGPLDIQFEKNTIRLVFKKEVEVLRFISL
jgi:outer membrane protein assembly factor BamB